MRGDVSNRRFGLRLDVGTFAESVRLRLLAWGLGDVSLLCGVSGRLLRFLAVSHDTAGDEGHNETGDEDGGTGGECDDGYLLMITDVTVTREGVIE